MAVNYTVRANVVDIRSDTPRSGDEFLVDSNVLYWMTYSRASLSRRPPHPYQVTAYPTYVLKALVAHATLARSELSLAELASLIESVERAVHTRSTGQDWDTMKKEYRHNLVPQRCQVASEIDAAWSVAQSLFQPSCLQVNAAVGLSVMQQLRTVPLDGYDSFLLETANQRGIAQLLTDDGDFCTVPDITVFTANQRVIGAASAAGRLVVR